MARQGTERQHTAGDKALNGLAHPAPLPFLLDCQHLSAYLSFLQALHLVLIRRKENEMPEDYDRLLIALEFERQQHEYWHRVATCTCTVLGGILGGVGGYFILKLIAKI